MQEQMISNGGLQFVPQIAAVQQIVYLDFDGETTSYNGEILALENVEVQNSRLTEERIAVIVSALNEKYALQGVVFVTEVPQNGSFSTVFVGKTSAFTPYGSFTGLAETIDKNNSNKSDKAFVNLDSTASDSAIISAICHETDHLLGTLDHGGDGLAAYAAGSTYHVSSGGPSIGLRLESGDRMYISSGGIANSTTVNQSAILYVYDGGTADVLTINHDGEAHISGGIANSTTVNYIGSMYISSGGIANSTIVNHGVMYIRSGGIANSTIVNSSGVMYISSGGTANDTTVNDGSMYISFGGIGNTVTVNDGVLRIISGGAVNTVSVNSGGYMYISSGASALEIVENGGYVYVADGAEVTFASNTIENFELSGSMTVHQGTVINVLRVRSRGCVYIYAGGIANSATVNSDGDVYINYGGFISGATVNGGGSVFISSGGSANTVSLVGYYNNGAKVYIYAGGVLESASVGSGGYLYISSGGTATNIDWTPCVGRILAEEGAVVNYVSDYTGVYYGSDGKLLSHEGAINGQTVEGYEEMHIMRNGSASLTTVDNGRLYVHSDGRADSTTVTDGEMYLSCGGVANSTTVDSDGGMYLSSGASASATFITGYYFVSRWKGGEMHISSGGFAETTSVVSGGSMHISSGGIANDITIDENGAVYVYAAGSADGVVVNAGADFYISSGGTATHINWTPCLGNIWAENGATINFTSQYSGVYLGSNQTLTSHSIDEISMQLVTGSMYVMNGGTAVFNTFDSGGILFVSSGGTAASNTVLDGTFNLFSGGTAQSNTVKGDGIISVYGGSADATIVNSGGSLCVASGGTATNIVLEDNSYLYLTVASDTYIQGSSGTSAFEMKDARLSGYTVNGGGVLVSSGGIADSTVVKYGYINIHNSGIASSTTVNGYGEMYISSGGIASSTTVNGSGSMHISSGGIANSTTVNGYGEMFIYSGGIASSTTVNGGDMNISSGGVASSTTVNGSGDMYIGSGGIASSTTVNGGDMYINSGGIASDVTVGRSGRLTMYDETAALRGTVSLAGSMTVSGVADVTSNTTINFQLQERSTKDSALLSGLDNIMAAVFTINVANNQANGTYALATGAENFNGTMTVTCGTNELGTLSVGGILESGYYSYQLVKEGGALNFTIDVLQLPVPTVTADITDLTNTDVVLTAVYHEMSVGKEYRIAGGEWQTYTTSVTVEQNCTVEFRGKDANGGYSEVVTYVVSNIDKAAPVISVTPDTTELTEKVSLTVTVTDENAYTLEYCFNNGSWNSCSGTLELGFNVEVGFRATDAAGNISYSTYTVDNVDQKGPFVTADITGFTNKNVTLSVYASPYALGKQYSYDQTVWYTCGDTLEVTENKTVYFREITFDGAPGEEISSYTVDNIDKAAPNAPAALTLTGSGDAVLLSWGEASDTGVAGVEGYNYRYGQTAYLSGDGEYTQSNEVTFADLTDGTWYFQVRSIDRAGNISGWSTVGSIFIDRIAPVITLTANTDIPVAKTVLYAATDDGSPLMYSSDGVNFENYTEPFFVEENGTWYFKAVDSSGNTSEESITFTNIDNTLPDQPVATVSVTDPTRYGVTVTVEYTGNAVEKQYSIDGSKWYTYTQPLTLLENGTLLFREKDLLGNFSEITSCTISNIDRSAPDIPGELEFTQTADALLVQWQETADNGSSGLAGYNFRYGNSANLKGNGVFLTESSLAIPEAVEGIWYFQVQSVDIAGNASQWSEVTAFTGGNAVLNLQSSPEGLSWDPVPGAAGYVVEYSTDNFATVVSVETTAPGLDAFALPQGSFNWRVKTLGGKYWTTGSEVAGIGSKGGEVFLSDADSVKDIFFAGADGIWERGFAAEHQETGERVFLTGKNKLADIFEGSSDASLLVMTDDANGDALFVDDIFTVLGDEARFSRIDEIRAGAGDDIVDMTSKRYICEDDSIKIYGGSGNDTIWGSAGTNILFGDAGDDRLAGSSGDDILTGGSGRDVMQGGGGDDIFVFGGDWGQDTVNQLPNGTVTLWFEEGSEANWNSQTRTYASGGNTVTVTGNVAVTLKFGPDASLPEGVFDAEASEKIFEDKNKGLLA